MFIYPDILPYKIEYVAEVLDSEGCLYLFSPSENISKVGVQGVD